jgi:succinate dehydrogenase/fumarate reductase flavoprotein subunit
MHTSEEDGEAMVSDNSKSKSRREILSGAAAGVAVLSAGVPAIASAAGTKASSRWDHEADVLVIGSGAAAMSAAIAVIQAGGKATLIEKAASVGGTSAKSAGAYWIPNHHLLRAKGIADPKVEAVRYMARDSYPAQFREELPDYGIGADRLALIETYYDNAAPIIEGLEKNGILKGMIAEVEDYFDHTPYDKVPRLRALVPQRPDGQIGRGLELIRQLKAWLTARNAPMLLQHAVTGVIKNGKREVIGVTADTPDGPVRIRARKGVIFGTGGYSQNQRLLQTFLRGQIHGSCSVPFAQGDFIKIGIEAGAMLGNMTGAWFSEVIVEQALVSPSVSVTMEIPPGDSMIVVNKYGKRVVDEKRNYNVRGRAHFAFDETEDEYPNDLLYMIFDERALELFAGNMHMPEPDAQEDYVISAPSIAALADAIQKRLDSHADKLGKRQLAPDFPDGLKAQINRFNADARKGVDTQFKRGTYPYDIDWHKNVDSVERKDTKWPHNPGPNFTMYPIADTGPYFAIILGAGMLDTNGGPIINIHSQVIDTHGKAIPGLYGAGNCIAAPGGTGYWGAGATLGPAMTFGTIAGRNAFAEAVKEL